MPVFKRNRAASGGNNTTSKISRNGAGQKNSPARSPASGVRHADQRMFFAGLRRASVHLRDKTGTQGSGKSSLLLGLIQILIILVLAALLVVLIVKNTQANRRLSVAPLETYASASSESAPMPSGSGAAAQATGIKAKSASGSFEPKAADSTAPGRYISEAGIMADGHIVSSFSFDNPTDMGAGTEYTAVQGIVTFRGNNFRDSAAFGTVNMINDRFSDKVWTVSTSSLKAPDGSELTGTAWVGQPLVMTWPKDVRAHMNMYDWAKKADTLTEVIYAAMDGNIYFLDLGTGKNTRDCLNLGYPFKGAGSLDPRGYPVLYLGSGADSTQGSSRAFIVSLLDCTVMYEFGNDDLFSLRKGGSNFVSSPLIDADTDRLIYPGENGIIYIMDLNTQYDSAAGKLSIQPSQIIKWRYAPSGMTKSSYLPGTDGSPVIWHSHLIVADSGGSLMCLNLNNLTLDWVQSTLDDTKSSPVFELENGHPYIYIGTTFHAGWRGAADKSASVPVWKIDAEDGHIVWKNDYACYTGEDVSGGVQGTIAVGKNKLSDLIFVPIARSPEVSTGLIAALKKDTGEIVWQKQTQDFSLSSPVTVYDKVGNGYVVFGTSGGYIYLFDGLTGKVLDSRNLEAAIEASPIVYNNEIVVGTRKLIFGINLS